MPAGETSNPFFKYFVLEVAFALERREWALSFMKWYWGEMLAHGARTLWELFDPLAEADTIQLCSRCHGYGTSPNAFLHTEVAGLRPAEPGFAVAYFNPLAGRVGSVRALVPTPSGHVSVSWEMRDDGAFEAEIAASYPLEIIPVLPSGLAARATIHVNDNVNVLQEAEDE